MLQNESVDDGIEHFEDIVENTDCPAITSRTTDKCNDILATLEKCNSDAEDACDTIECVSPISSGEKDGKGTSAEGLTLQASYNPRHREPSYWYCLFTSISLYVCLLPFLCMGYSD